MTFASHTGSFASKNVPLFHGGDLFGVQTNAGNVTLSAATSAADLKVTSVSATATSVQTGQNLTVNYAVQNLGNATSATSWVDAVFLSASGKLDSSAILLGRVTQSGPLAANGSYNGKLTATVPGLSPGNYFVIVEADSQGLVPDSNRANNVLAATTPVQVSVPTLTLAPVGSTPTPVTGSVAAGQDAVFQLNIPAGEDVVINDKSDLVNLLVGYGSIPTVTNNLAQNLAFGPSQQVILHSTQAGTYYVVLQGVESANFSLTAQALGFGITSVSPGGLTVSEGILVDLSKDYTFTITGNDFTPNTTVSLVGTPISQPVTEQIPNVVFKDSHALFATVTADELLAVARPEFSDTENFPVLVDVQVTDHGVTAGGGAFSVRGFGPFEELDDEIVNASRGAVDGLVSYIQTPSAVRVDRPYTLTVTYQNVSDADIPAPLLELSGQGAEFQLPGQSSFTPNSILLFAGNPNGEGGVLPPGFTGSITVTVIATTGGQINLQLGVADPNATIDWSSQESTLQPPGVTNDAWNAIFSNFTAEVGDTMGGLQTALDNDATYLSQLGEYTSDVNTLLEFQLEQAGDFGAIAQRYTPGIFGLGIPDPTLTAVTDSQGNVNIVSGGTVRPFTLQPDGSYQGAPGDFATLTLSNGIYQLRETNGTLEVFNPNGSLNFIEDTNGNKLVYGYTGSQLTNITNTANGDVTTFTYNAQSLVSQITDPEGRITSLIYDSAGHLLSLTNPQGTTSYTYVASGTPQQLNALASTTNPDGSQFIYTYNSQGQLIGQTQNGGANPLTFSYNVGAITTTDAFNDKFTEFLDDNEQIAEVIDPLGNITHVGYNSNLGPTSFGLPGGLTSSIAYDTLGNPISTIDPLGQQTTATYNQTFSVPQTVTDPLGHSLNFSYDPATGNLLGITYPDGSSQQYEYDALGQVTQFTNRNSQAIAYTYFPNGLLKSETNPDGSQNTFNYDNHRNLVSMTDSTGTTTFTYDSADRLTKVTYPNGSFLSYTYNSAGQRTQMTDQTGFTVNYQYDTLGRLTELTDANGKLIVSYTYNSAGRLASKQFGNGTVTNYTYDAGGNVLSIVNLTPDGKTVQSSYVYTYNSQNLPVTMTTLAGTFTYGYDAYGQLTSVKTPDGQTITYQYDAAGNRIAVVDNGTTTPYTTNDLNEYTQAGNTTYQYDANGELISSTNSSGTTSYNYNALGQLVSVVSPSGTTTYQYDALGQLVSESINGTVTNFLNDPTGSGNIVGQFNTKGSPVSQYAYGLGLVSQVAGGSSNFYSFDAVGNTTQLTGANGSVLNTYSYLPFGEQIQSTGSAANSFTFGGQFGVMNGAGSLYFMRNRWYDPGLGRFTQPDPIGISGGSLDLYTYAQNSPLTFVDPTGTDPIGPHIGGPGSGQVNPGNSGNNTGFGNTGGKTGGGGGGQSGGSGKQGKSFQEELDDVTGDDEDNDKGPKPPPKLPFYPPILSPPFFRRRVPFRSRNPCRNRLRFPLEPPLHPDQAH